MTSMQTAVFRVRVKRIIESQKISQVTLSQKSGVNQGVISKFLSGDTRELDEEKAAKIATGLEVSLELLRKPGVVLSKPGLISKVLHSRAVRLLKKVGNLAKHFIPESIREIMAEVGKELPSGEEIAEEWKKLTASGLAWVLVQRAATAAVDEIIEKVVANYPDVNQEELAQASANMIEEVLDEGGIIVDEAFFKQPSGKFLSELKSRLIDELLKASPKETESKFEQLNQSTAIAAVSSLEREFVYALHAEEQANSREYASLREAGGALVPAIVQQQQLEIYNLWLRKQISKPVFFSTIPLENLYIPLRCSIELKREKGSDTPKKRISILEEEIIGWLKDLDKDYQHGNAVRFITSGAGTGKSTSSKFIAAKLLEQRSIDGMVVLAPLHEFPWAKGKDLLDAVKQFSEKHQPPIPVSEVERSRSSGLMVLILDGLDEMAKSGDSGLNAARDLVTEAIVWLKRHEECRWAIVFAGRPIATDFAKNSTVSSTLVYNVEPYLIPKENRQEYQGERKLIERDQRDDWWWKYTEAAGHYPTYMPERLKNKSTQLDEITSLPMMGYMVARKLLSRDSQVKFDENFHLASLYEGMVNEVFERNYAGWKNKAIEHLEKSDYGKLLDYVGWSAWKRGGRAVTQDQVVKVLPKKLKQKLKTIGGPEAIFLNMYLVSQDNPKGETAYEFSHKSFGEYLAARRLADATFDIFQKWLRLKKSEATGSESEQALVEWAKWFGPVRLTHDLMKFLEPAWGVLFRKEAASAAKFARLLFRYVLKKGVPIHLALAGKSFQRMNQQAIHLEESLLAFRAGIVRLLSEEDLKTPELLKIDWSDSDAASRYLGSLLSTLPNYTSIAARSLRCTNLSRIVLRGANLRGADLSKVDLTGADLSGANLISANLCGANLNGANLNGADFSGANLSSANLSGANLSGACLLSVNLNDSNLSGAYLLRTELSSADLRRVRLIGTNLNGACLIDAYFGGANLTQCLVERKQFTEEQLRQFKGNPNWIV